MYDTFIGFVLEIAKVCITAGLQYNLPATWDGMQKRHLPQELIAKLFSEVPARLAGLSSQKGAIKEGLDADFVVSHATNLMNHDL